MANQYLPKIFITLSFLLVFNLTVTQGQEPELIASSEDVIGQLRADISQKGDKEVLQKFNTASAGITMWMGTGP